MIAELRKVKVGDQIMKLQNNVCTNGFDQDWGAAEGGPGPIGRCLLEAGAKEAKGASKLLALRRKANLSVSETGTQSESTDGCANGLLLGAPAGLCPAVGNRLTPGPPGMGNTPIAA